VIRILCRVVFWLCLLLVAVPFGSAVAATMPSSPLPSAVPAPNAPRVCTDGPQDNGAVYRICLPASWNGDLVIYAHGYVAPNRPVGIPEDQFVLAGIGSIDQIVTNLGYAFAASSYRANGLVVYEGIEDSLDVVRIFSELHGKPGKVYLAGVSEGGLIAALSMEQHQDVYAGALALCGPYGDFTRHVDYLGDFRTVFDLFFPGVIPGSPVSIPPALLDTWETGTYSATVKALIMEPANAITVTQLLSVTQAPTDPADPTTREATVERLLWYNIYATNDATARFGGQPYENEERQYTGSTDDEWLNDKIERYTADETARSVIRSKYETTGHIQAPVIALHTTGDPVVPVWHLDGYRARIAAAGKANLYEEYRFDRYGHCSFTFLEVLGAFNRLVSLVEANEVNQSRTLFLPAVLGATEPSTQP
jgi:pimeloyl-ACP methyl ester carboxylesterase